MRRMRRTKTKTGRAKGGERGAEAERGRATSKPNEKLFQAKITNLNPHRNHSKHRITQFNDTSHTSNTTRCWWIIIDEPTSLIRTNIPGFSLLQEWHMHFQSTSFVIGHTVYYFYAVSAILLFASSLDDTSAADFVLWLFAINFHNQSSIVLICLSFSL